MRQHLRANKYIDKVIVRENEELLGVGKELLLISNITDDPILKPRNISKRYLQHIKRESYQQKQLHGYVGRKVAADNNIDQITSKTWLTLLLFAHFEAHACTIQEREIGTKNPIYRRCIKNNQKEPTSACFANIGILPMSLVVV